MKCHCDYCNADIETTKDSHSYFAELRAVYCAACSKRYQNQREKDKFYDGCMRHMWTPGNGACPSCNTELEKLYSEPESKEETK